MRGKKGEGGFVDSMPFYVIFVIVVGVLILIFSIITQWYTADRYALLEGLEQDILTRRFLSSTCFGAIDLLPSRDAPVLDWERFDRQHLDYCYSLNTTAPFFAYRLSLSYDTSEKSITTTNWNDQRNARERKQVPVRVLRDGAVKDSKLIIEVQYDIQ